MNRVHGIKLDFNTTEKLDTEISYKQYDVGSSFLAIQLLHDNQIITILNETIIAIFKNGTSLITDKNDKIVNSIAYIDDQAEGVILLPIPSEIIEKTGIVTCELVILSSDGARRTSPAFSFSVVKSLSKLNEELPPDEELQALCGRFLCGELRAGEGIEILRLNDDGSYSPTNWKDNVTPVNAKNLNKIELALQDLSDKVINLNSVDISYTTTADSEILTVKDALDKLLYVPITINLFNLSKSIAEKGEIISNLLLNWSYNKSPQIQSIDGNVVDNSLRNYTYLSDVKANKTFKLEASDGKTTVSKNVSINFYNGRYFGKSTSLEYNDDLILSLNKNLTDTRATTFIVNAGPGEYIYFCIPTRFGTPGFKVGGFEGGFSKVNTINFTNKFGYSENYDIWKSNNSNLGNTTVEVK